MYLKSIEIIGFKSFADKTILTFEPGVTGVVGPNGSGKSNITEAIRWVLGETSAKSLRGGKMPDVIFAGSQSRRGINIAEVTVILDNQDHYLPIDFNEVSVKRSLNRNGDSDYYINKKHVRLKDIQELFMDSGLGKESFSIISQGKVEEIFNSKPEDRRGIFEEAAGVFKYKQKKKAAEQKLFETEDNLNRLNDILYELKSQLAPLAFEKEQAEKFLRLKEELKKQEVSFVAEKIARNAKEKTAKEIEFKQLNEEYTAVNLKNEQVVSELAQKKKNHETLDQDYTKAQDEQVALTKLYEQAHSKKQLFQEKSLYQIEKKEQAEKEVALLGENIKVLLKELEENKETLLKNQTLLDDLEGNVSEQEELVKRYSRSVKEQLADLRADFIEVMQQETNQLNDYKHNERLISQLLEQKTANLAKKEKITTESEEVTASLTDLKNRQQAAQEKMERLLAIVSDKQKKLDELQKNYDSLYQEYYQQLGNFQQKQARLKSLEDIQKSHSGYYQGVRQILRNPNLKGIEGPVIELMSVPKEFTLGIETALGGTIQHLIVEDETAAKGAIEYLKAQHLGRATFLPLTTIKPRQLPNYIFSQLENDPNFAGVASEVISYDEKYANIYQYLLGTTILAKDLTGAIAIAKKVRHQFKVVSLQGDVMNAGGSMTGGAKSSNQTGLLAQKNEQETLEKVVTTLKEQLVTLENQVKNSQGAQEKLKEDLLVLRKNEELGRQLIQELTSEIASEEKDLLQLEKETQVLVKEEEHALVQLNELKVEQKNLLEQQEKSKLAKDQIQNEMNHVEKDSSQSEVLREKAQEKLQAFQKEQAILETQQEQLRQLVAKEETQLKTQEDTLTLAKEELEQLGVNSFALSQEEIEAQLKEAKEKQTALIEEIKALKEKRSHVYEEITVLEKVSNETYEKQHLLAGKIATLSQELTYLNEQLDQHLQFLQEEYELTFEQAKAEFLLTMSLEETAKLVKTIKKNIQDIGPVNLGAIESYDQVSERFTFLTGQKEDLMDAKDHLFATMDEMDEEVKHRFMSTFKDISAQFEEVFPKMFGGGFAKLVLTDPKDILHTGIEITAQPPGKKLQSLNLLSGGERALTAITLLFAILQVRPVPFTVLDEVEAALDEANVVRFGRYLQSFKDQRQFIVVTHRKGTMEACDVLYGVTMEESGVSKILSVQLKDIVDNGEIKKS